MSQVLSSMYFRITLLPEVPVWLKPQGPFHSFVWTYLLLLWSWQIPHAQQALAELLCRHAVDRAINHTGLWSSWNDALALPRPEPCFRRPRVLDWLNSQVDEEGVFDPDEGLTGLTVSPSVPWSTRTGPWAGRAGVESIHSSTPRSQRTEDSDIHNFHHNQ